MVNSPRGHHPHSQSGGEPGTRDQRLGQDLDPQVLLHLPLDLVQQPDSQLVASLVEVVHRCVAGQPRVQRAQDTDDLLAALSIHSVTVRARSCHIADGLPRSGRQQWGSSSEGVGNVQGGAVLSGFWERAGGDVGTFFVL